MAESRPQPSPQQYGPQPNRACEFCRFRKLRCLPSDPLLSSKCERCFTLNQECVHALPAKRKPRKRADPKIVQLEREVKALSAILRKQQQQSQPSEASPTVDRMQIEPEESTSWPIGSSSASDSSPMSTPFTSPGSHPELEKDVIGKGMLSQDSAQKYFEHFTRMLIKNHPFLVFPENVALDEFRLSRPATFLAIMAAGSAAFNPTLCGDLYKVLTTTFAEQIIVNGAKTLDLLQALVIGILWHHPGDTFDSYNYSQYAQLAGAIVSWLRLGKGHFALASHVTTRSAESNATPIGDGGSKNLISDEPLEQQRTFLAAYIIGARVASKQSQPSIIPFASWVEGYAAQVESSPDVTDADKTLVALVRQQRIIEDFTSSRGGDGIAVPIDLGNPRLQSILKSFDQQLSAWKLSVGSLLTPAMEILFYANQVYLHEMAMYIDHDPLGFRLPYTLDRKPSTGTEEKQSLTPTHIDALFACQSGSQQALDIFLKTELDVLRACPDVTFMTTNYCVVILLKLLASVLEPSSPIYGLVDWQSLRVSYYLDHVGNQFRSAAGGQLSTVATQSAKTLDEFQKWYSTNYGFLEGDSEDVLQTFRYLDVQQCDFERESLAALASAHLAAATHPKNSEIAGSEYLQDSSLGSWQLALNEFDFMDVGGDMDGNSFALLQDLPEFDALLLENLSSGAQAS